MTSRWINTSCIDPSDPTTLPPAPDVIDRIYCGLDCAVTHEVNSALAHCPRPEAEHAYRLSRHLNAIACEMTVRGIRIDPLQRFQATQETDQLWRHCRSLLDQLALAATGRVVNPGSPSGFADFLYAARPRGLGIKPRFALEDGEYKLTTGKEALESIEEEEPFWSPIINTARAAKDAAKRLGVLKGGIDPDGRFRSSFHVAGTETWRWSSSKSPFGTGSNQQNLTERLRRMFIPDPGYLLCYFDLSSAESFDVAFLSGDEAYIQACLSGDIHTQVAKMVWPSLGWTGDPKQDRKIANQPYFGRFTYRDLAKRGGHGANYGLRATSMARHLKIPEPVAEAFLAAYFSAFPGIARWHRTIRQTILTTRTITTPFGHQRRFHGRPTEDSTIREAIAFTPQSSTATCLNLGLIAVHSHLAPHGLQVLGQVHDAILFQVPEQRALHLLPEALRLMHIPTTINGRTLTIPVEGEAGWNWAHTDPTCRFFPDGNPNGLRGIEKLPPHLYQP